MKEIEKYLKLIEDEVFESLVLYASTFSKIVKIIGFDINTPKYATFPYKQVQREKFKIESITDTEIEYSILKHGALRYKIFGKIERKYLEIKDIKNFVYDDIEKMILGEIEKLENKMEEIQREEKTLKNELSKYSKELKKLSK